MFGYIYLTTNLVNGKKYIGKHKFSGPGIDKKYLGSGSSLQKAIKKYGSENFKTEILETCDSVDELNEREKFWINLFNASEDNNFYNIAFGGDGGDVITSLSPEKKLLALQKRKETWKNNNTYIKMSLSHLKYYQEHPEARVGLSDKLKKFNLEHPEVAMLRSKLYTGRPWSDLQKRQHLMHVARGKDNKNSRECICIETQERFVSATEAAEKYGGSYKVIWKCCKGQCKTAAGFHWTFCDDTARQQEFAEFIGKERKIFRDSKQFGYK